MRSFNMINNQTTSWLRKKGLFSPPFPPPLYFFMFVVFFIFYRIQQTFLSPGGQWRRRYFVMFETSSYLFVVETQKEQSFKIFEVLFRMLKTWHLTSSSKVFSSQKFTKSHYFDLKCLLQFETEIKKMFYFYEMGNNQLKLLSKNLWTKF